MTAPLVGVDVGGTNISGVWLDRTGAGPTTGEVAADLKRSTPAGTAAAVAEAIAEVVHALHDAPGAVGIGTPGVVRSDTGLVLYAPNLPGFDRAVPLGAMVTERPGARPPWSTGSVGSARGRASSPRHLTRS